MYLLQGVFRKIVSLVLSLLISIIAIGCFAYLYLDNQLPDVASLKSAGQPIPLRVYSSDGQLIAEFGELKRTPVTLNQVPPMLIKAILATEDSRFYEHSGVDVLGLMRAASELALTGTKAQGGSTITMQVARNFYLTRKKTFLRKLTEILLALKIEREFTKDEILELYLNKIFLGNRAYGVAAGAQVYFGKTLDQLTLPQMAVLAGLPKAPSTINPLANPIASKDRRNHVLERMYEIGYIDKKTYENAVKTPLDAAYHGVTVNLHAPYVAEMVRNMMVTSFGDDAYAKGFNVYTTISPKLQIAANNALRTAVIAYDHRHGYRGVEGNLGLPDSSKTDEWLEALAKIPTINELQPAAVISMTGSSVNALLGDGETITIPWKGLEWAHPQLKKGFVGAAPRSADDVVQPGDIIRVQQEKDGSWSLAQIPKIEGAIVAMNPTNGSIQALVGGFDFQRSKYNRAVQMKRQPGSGFKPFIYSSALARGFTLASVFMDAPISFYIPTQGVWAPQNDDHKYMGPLRLRMALVKSRNTVSVRVLQAVGIGFALNYVGRFGFDPKQLPRNYSLALGTGEVTPLEMVRGYSTFANGGYRITPYLIDHITDDSGKTIYQAAPKIACAPCITEQDSSKPPSADAGIQYAPQAIPPQIAFLMTSVLQDVIKMGTGRGALVLKRGDIGGKTGTNGELDTWFNGFNSDIVATVWMGFDTPAPIREYAAQAALPMWIDFMRVALDGTPEHTMPEPPGITSTAIDPYSGYQRSDSGTEEYFRTDNMPAVESEPASPYPMNATDTESASPFPAAANNNSDHPDPNSSYPTTAENKNVQTFPANTSDANF